ncbi:hypothetical protein SMB93_004033 [Cronobacter sakazakii]|nr:hypothetical protein [Cronobacter sakazakii]ELY2780652.1 hypothetical protein [Cronobacter sakazakii]
MGDVISGLLSFSACEVMAFPANQEFALSFGVRVGKRYGAGDCSGLEFLPGYLFRVLGEWRSEKLPFSRRFLVVIEICFMGSVAWGNEVGLFGSLAGRGGYCLGVGYWQFLFFVILFCCFLIA